MRAASLSALLCLLAGGVSVAQQPTYTQGTDIFIETGVDQPDRVPTWYASMVAKPYAPVFEILATCGTQGRYYPYTYPVTLKDIVKWHGHDCEGLTHAACASRIALSMLFPDSIIDRSVLWAITGESPCWSDVAAFLSGARVQYGNLAYFKDKKYGHAILYYREDTRKAVLATWKKGINNIAGEPVVLPDSIRWKPRMDIREMMALKETVRKLGGQPTPHQVDKMRFQQWSLVNEIVSRPLNESYQAKFVENFKWEEWIDSSKVIGARTVRTDVRLKNHPYRAAPIDHAE